MVLRHPIERVLAGLSERAGRTGDLLSAGVKPRNRLLTRAFMGIGRDDGINRFLDALRLVQHPLHAVAMRATHSRRQQVANYLLPISEYYLAHAKGLSQPIYLCVSNLSAEWLAKVANPLGLPPPPGDTRLHRSRRPNDFVGAAGLIHEANQRWLSCVYAADIQLLRQHCGLGDQWADWWP